MKRFALTLLTSLILLTSLAACYQDDHCFREGLVMPVLNENLGLPENCDNACIAAYYGPECSPNGDEIICPVTYDWTSHKFDSCRRYNENDEIMHCPITDVSGMEMCYQGFWRKIYYTYYVPSYDWWKTCKYACDDEYLRKQNGDWCDRECLDDVNYHDYDAEYHAYELELEAQNRDEHHWWDDDDDD